MKDKDLWLLAHSMRTEILLIRCGEALENSISAMMNLGAPFNLCELVEAREVVVRLNGLLELTEGISFSALLGKMEDRGTIEAVELIGQHANGKATQTQSSDNVL